MDRRTLLEWLRLVRTPGLGRVGMGHLLRFFGHPQAVLDASGEELAQVPGIRPALLARLQSGRRQPAPESMSRELDRLTALGGRMLLRGGPGYPSLLEAIHDPPPVLFVLGEAAHLTGDRGIAIVGSRNASRQGERFAHHLAVDLARQGLLTISGVARGIDAAAHRGALEGRGVTIGVLATGLDVDYPPANRALKETIVQNGCLLSEAPLGTKPHPGLFPPRNRIISGLSRGVVVVEASDRSGSLITARLALEQGREVFAVPGPVGDSRSRGVHLLLRQGARLVEGIEDILEELSWCRTPVPQVEESSNITAGKQKVTNGPAARVLEELGRGSLPGDDLARRCQLTVSNLSRILLQLELAGMVERLPGNRYGLIGH